MMYINLYNHVIQPGRRSDEFLAPGWSVARCRTCCLINSFAFYCLKGGGGRCLERPSGRVVGLVKGWDNLKRTKHRFLPSNVEVSCNFVPVFTNAMNERMAENYEC